MFIQEISIEIEPEVDKDEITDEFDKDKWTKRTRARRNGRLHEKQQPGAKK